MDPDTDRIEEAVLALLHLTVDRDGRAWKSFDWGAMERLHRKGFLSNPVGKARSVVLSEKEFAESERLLPVLFERRVGST